MKQFKSFFGLFSFVLIFLILMGLGMNTILAKDNARERAEIEEQYKWNLRDLFVSNEVWQSAKEKVAEKFDKLDNYEGKLGESAEVLYDALEYMHNVEKELIKLYVYAHMLSDQDKRESGPLAMEQQMQQLDTDFSKMTAYVEPEILKIDEKKLQKFMQQKPELKVYSQFFDDIIRRKIHTLSAEKEELVAEAGRMAGTAQSIYSIFKDADMIRPVVELSDGTEVTLDDAGYAGNRARNVREDRIKVFEAFFGELNKYRRTWGTQLNGEVQKNIFYKNARNYESCLERALDRNNIPVTVYHKLIENINKNLPTLHRYLKLRKRMLGVDELHYYDMYPSLVKDVDLIYTYQEAKSTINKALAVLGDEYVETLDRAYNERWIDVFPNTGKRSGAYSQGSAYDIHPYILMNYNGKYTDMSTLAHELGHTMHSYFSNKNQPYVNASYPIFLAEVASTANEAILMDHELKRIKDPQERLSLLGSYLESFRTTLFRQTQFAEFELKIHELAEKGEALTGDRFNEIYLDILKRYYGHDEGVTVIEDLYAIEWAYIPHFYYNFYVYQYSTSFTASQALAQKMMSGGKDMVENYLAFLSSGRSEYAIPTLKKVGIDMTTDEPFNITMQKMNNVMDEIEKILEEMDK